MKCTISLYLQNKYIGNWKQINEKPSYYISDKGLVWSKYNNDIIKQRVISGYNSINIGYPDRKF